MPAEVEAVSHRDRIRRFPIGATVQTNDGVRVEVLRHGRDVDGPYTEVKMPDGTRVRFHRSWLKSVTPVTPSPSAVR